MPHLRSTARLLRAGIAVLTLLLASCGGSGNSQASGGTDCSKPTAQDSSGCAYISLSDAPGDFLTYTVKVTKLELTRADGASVQVLPKTTTVDFAQYSNLSEFLTAADMPLGTYVSGVISLDYTGADIEAEDAGGNPVKLSPVDASGNPVTTLDLSIRLDTGGALVLVPGVPHLLDIDFDLDASNIVNSDDTVTVQPFLLASVDPASGVEQRLRGPLSSVDTANNRFVLGLRPFSAIAGDYGPLSVYINADTTFDIDQQSSAGAAGLTALMAAGPTTAVSVLGQFDFTHHRFIADQVFAGSSVPGGTLDAAQGVVVSRSGDTVVLRGTTLYRAGQTAVFRDTVTVTLGSGTKVHEVGDPAGSFGIGDISVGQALLVFGSLTNTNAASLQLDASNGFALMEYTSVDGTVFVSGGGSLIIDVQQIQGRPISLFDFTGTGVDPGNYHVEFTGAGPIVTGAVRVIGFPAPYGTAVPDFTASTLVEGGADTLLSIGWSSPGTGAAFTLLSADNGMALNLASGPTLHRLRQGGVVTDLFSLASAPTVDGDTFGVYAILQNGTVQVHLSFSGFISDLQTRLAAGARVRGCFAVGGFDGTTDVLSSDRVAVILQ